MIGINLIAEIPPKECTERVVYCDGGDPHLGHPKVYINLVMHHISIRNEEWNLQPKYVTNLLIAFDFRINQDHMHVVTVVFDTFSKRDTTIRNIFDVFAAHIFIRNYIQLNH